MQMWEDYYLDNYEAKMVRFGDKILLALDQAHLIVSKKRKQFNKE